MKLDLAQFGILFGIRHVKQQRKSAPVFDPGAFGLLLRSPESRGWRVEKAPRRW